MTYSYRCSNGHCFEATFRIGEAPENLPCSGCPFQADRDFGADFPSVTYGIVDPYRNFHLSSKALRAEGEQQRRLDAPVDNFDRKRLERDFGRLYIGDDVGNLRKGSREAIEMYKDKVGR